MIFQYDEQHTNVSVEMKFYISWSGIAWGTPLSKSFKGCEIFFLKREKERAESANLVKNSTEKYPRNIKTQIGCVRS